MIHSGRGVKRKADSFYKRDNDPVSRGSKVKNEERIWQVVHGIPQGRVATYGQVARLAGLPGYARYVGTVLKKLPPGSRLPWHRVVNARGCLSFPSHSSKHRQQRSLLESEGIVFINGRLSLLQYGVDQLDT